MRWSVSNRAEPAAREIADRHYNRQKVGAPQFVPPGRCVVLLIPEKALWVTSWPFAEYVKHAWAGAWVCSAFRNEDPLTNLSSELVREAVAATRWTWPDVPALGMITFVDEAKTRTKRDPGRCFRRAGFVLDAVADAMTYLSLVAGSVGCDDLEGLLASTFNMVSERAGSALRVTDPSESK